MRTTIRRWGNSLALRIPRTMAADLGVVDGAEVELSMTDDGMLTRPARPKRVRLNDLVRKITDRNRHEAEETGPPVGREVW